MSCTGPRSCEIADDVIAGRRVDLRKGPHYLAIATVLYIGMGSHDDEIRTVSNLGVWAGDTEVSAVCDPRVRAHDAELVPSVDGVVWSRNSRARWQVVEGAIDAYSRH